jgi:hypothetical protein
MDPNANEGVSAFSGLKYFRALMEGSIARSAMLKLFDINIEAVLVGRWPSAKADYSTRRVGFSPTERPPAMSCVMEFPETCFMQCQPLAKTTAERPVRRSNSAADETACWLVRAAPSAAQT